MEPEACWEQHTEEPAMQLWPATIASPPSMRRMLMVCLMVSAKAMPPYSREEQEHMGSAPRPMAQGARVCSSQLLRDQPCAVFSY